MYKYKAKITNIVDGDTFDLDIDLGFHIHIHERVRLLGIDCPEKSIRNGEREKIAGQFITYWAETRLLNKDVIIESFKGTDSFGRWLVKLYVALGDQDEPADIVYTYNALGFNKLDKNYDLEKLIRERC